MIEISEAIDYENGGLFYPVFNFINDLYKISIKKDPLKILLQDFIESHVVTDMSIYILKNKRYEIFTDSTALEVFKKISESLGTTDTGLSGTDNNRLGIKNLFVLLTDVYEYKIIKECTRNDLWWLPTNHKYDLQKGFKKRFKQLEFENKNLRNEKNSISVKTVQVFDNVEQNQLENELQELKRENADLKKKIQKSKGVEKYDKPGYQEGQGDSLLILGALL